jgi:hypothetical protein
MFKNLAYVASTPVIKGVSSLLINLIFIQLYGFNELGKLVPLLTINAILINLLDLKLDQSLLSYGAENVDQLLSLQIKFSLVLATLLIIPIIFYVTVLNSIANIFVVITCIALIALSRTNNILRVRHEIVLDFKSPRILIVITEMSSLILVVLAIYLISPFAIVCFRPLQQAIERLSYFALTHEKVETKNTYDGQIWKFSTLVYFTSVFVVIYSSATPIIFPLLFPEGKVFLGKLYFALQLIGYVSILRSIIYQYAMPLLYDRDSKSLIDDSYPFIILFGLSFGILVISMFYIDLLENVYFMIFVLAPIGLMRLLNVNNTITFHRNKNSQIDFYLSILYLMVITFGLYSVFLVNDMRLIIPVLLVGQLMVFTISYLVFFRLRDK